MVFAFDGIQRTGDFILSLAENITDHAVKITRGYDDGGFLPKQTALLVTRSNVSPKVLYPMHFAMINVRFCIVNLRGPRLLDLINHIRQIHNLPALVANNDELIPRFRAILLDTRSRYIVYTLNI